MFYQLTRADHVGRSRKLVSTWLYLSENDNAELLPPPMPGFLTRVMALFYLILRATYRGFDCALLSPDIHNFCASFLRWEMQQLVFLSICTCGSKVQADSNSLACRSTITSDNLGPCMSSKRRAENAQNGCRLHCGLRFSSCLVRIGRIFPAKIPHGHQTECRLLHIFPYLLSSVSAPFEEARWDLR